MNIGTWFENQKIRNKIILIYFPLLILPLFVLGYAANSIFAQAIVEKTIQNVSDNSRLIITRIDGILANGESCADMLTINLNKLISRENNPQKNNTNELQLYNQINNQLSFALLIFNDVESAAFIDTDHKLYSSDAKMGKEFHKALDSGFLKRIEKTSGTNIWFPMQRRDYLVTDADCPVLTLGKEVFDINTGQKLGTLILNIQEKAFSSIYNKIGSSKQGHYFIVDKQGRVVSSQNPTEVLNPIDDQVLKDWILGRENYAEIKRISGKKMLLTSTAFSYSEWKLVNRASLGELTADSRKISIIIFLIGFLCLTFALMGTAFLSRLIVRPIDKLTSDMLKIKDGNLNVHCEMNSTDEVGLLAAGFNTMVSRINSLLRRVEHEQKRRREYELALIQAQIKPHFLYNSLDAIYVLSQMGRTKEAQKTTKALADFYRVALSGGQETITIREEIKNVKDYLSIQKIRYSDVFDYDIKVDEEIMDCQILKLTIQPLVENAIYHGLKTKESMGTIKISGCRVGTNVVLKVTDDGVGISPERLEEVLTQADGRNQQASFGIRSVNQRLKLFFGTEYGLAIESELGKGTEVTIYLPWMHGRGGTND